MTRLLAILLLWTDCPAPAVLDAVPGLEAELRAVAEAAEWLDPGETIGWDYEDCPLPQPLPPSTQVYWLRDLRNALAGTPRPSEFPRLPDWNCAVGQADFAQAHLRFIRAKRAICTRDLRGHYDEWIAEAQGLCDVWLSLAEAVNPGLRIRERRWALGEVAARIGRDALDRGDLPPPAPLWRFRRIP